MFDHVTVRSRPVLVCCASVDILQRIITIDVEAINRNPVCLINPENLAEKASRGERGLFMHSRVPSAVDSVCSRLFNLSNT